MILTDASNRWNNTALLILRLGFAFIMIFYHGWIKMTHPDWWEGIGGAMTHLGIDFAPKFWGFMQAFAETVCAALIGVGLFTRPAALILSIGLTVGMITHFNSPEEKDEAGIVKALIVAVFFMLAGAGRYSLDARFKK
jgi:putative oxidoreductase